MYVYTVLHLGKTKNSYDVIITPADGKACTRLSPQQVMEINRFVDRTNACQTSLRQCTRGCFAHITYDILTNSPYQNITNFMALHTKVSRYVFDNTRCLRCGISRSSQQQLSHLFSMHMYMYHDDVISSSGADVPKTLRQI